MYEDMLDSSRLDKLLLLINRNAKAFLNLLQYLYDLSNRLKSLLWHFVFRLVALEILYQHFILLVITFSLLDPLKHSATLDFLCLVT